MDSKNKTVEVGVRFIRDHIFEVPIGTSEEYIIALARSELNRDIAFGNVGASKDDFEAVILEM